MKALLPALALAATAASAATHVSIELRPQVRSAGPSVTLGELAVLRSPDLALMRALVDLPVLPVPTPGTSSVVERAAVLERIRHGIGIGDVGIEWHGPPSAHVAATGGLVRGEDIAGNARSALREWLLRQGHAVSPELHALPRDLEVGAGAVRLVARPIAATPLRSRQLVWVDVRVGERFVRVVPVAFVVTAAAAQGGRGAPSVPGVGVLRGQWASLRSLAGAVAVESRVEVLQDGAVGQQVHVRPPGGGALVATVTAPGQLEVAR